MDNKSETKLYWKGGRGTRGNGKCQREMGAPLILVCRIQQQKQERTKSINNRLIDTRVWEEVDSIVAKGEKNCGTGELVVVSKHAKGNERKRAEMREEGIRKKQTKTERSG
jgi:hypothetical protein